MTPREAWQRWQAAAGPWQGWTVCPVLSGAFPPADAPVPPGREYLALPADVVKTLRATPTLVLLDLDVCLSIQLAAELFRQHAAHPVLLIARWPYAQAVLPTEPMLQTMLAEAARLPNARSRLPSVAFALDNRRTTPLSRRPTNDPRADNRYRVSVADLPTLKTLRARGIQHVLKLSQACAP
jgi:hypothetical protein